MQNTFYQSDFCPEKYTSVIVEARMRKLGTLIFSDEKFPILESSLWYFVDGIHSCVGEYRYRYIDHTDNYIFKIRANSIGSLYYFSKIFVLGMPEKIKIVRTKNKDNKTKTTT